MWRTQAGQSRDVDLGGGQGYTCQRGYRCHGAAAQTCEPRQAREGATQWCEGTE